MVSGDLNPKMEKTCTKCLASKDIEQFPKRAGYKGGRTTWCRGCLSERARIWAKNNKEKVSESGKKSRAKHPNTRRNAKFKERYGITLVEYDLISASQFDKCLICKKHKSECKNNKLFVDHCHTSKEIRGLLCNDCNAGLGFFKDSIELLLSAIEYLNKPRKRRTA
jgi:hypothetical protein